MARQRRPAGCTASQKHIRSCQGNTGRQTLAAYTRAQAAPVHGSRHHTKEFIDQSISNQGQRTGPELVAVDVDRID